MPISRTMAKPWPWLMLPMRSALFLASQALVALILWLGGRADAWNGSAAWWPVMVTLTNGVTLALLARLYRAEGLRFWDVFRIERQHLGRDLLTMLGVLILAGPIAMAPNLLLAQALFGDMQAGASLLVRPLPLWGAIVAVALFPLTQGLAELPAYMLYARPRIEQRGVSAAGAVALAAFFLSAQHVFIPLLFDAGFIVYRLLMFLPFAFYVALILRWRPRLMPYLAVMHLLMDLSLGVMFLSV